MLTRGKRPIELQQRARTVQKGGLSAGTGPPATTKGRRTGALEQNGERGGISG